MSHQDITLDNVLRLSGEEDKLREILVNRLIESGWEAEMKLACSRIIKSQGVENVTLEMLIKELTPIGRDKIPAEIKKEMLDRIKSSLTKHVDENNL